MMAVALVAAISFSACSDDDDPLQALSQPVILQSEQMNDNPITIVMTQIVLFFMVAKLRFKVGNLTSNC